MATERASRNRLLLYDTIYNRLYNAYCSKLLLYSTNRLVQRFSGRLLHNASRLHNVASEQRQAKFRGGCRLKGPPQGFFWPYCSISGANFSAVGRSDKGFNRRPLESVASLIGIAGERCSSSMLSLGRKSRCCLSFACEGFVL